VEVLVVMAIVATLATLSLVAIFNQQGKAREKDTKLRIATINRIITTYLEAGNNLPALTTQGGEDSSEIFYETLTGDVNHDGVYDSLDVDGMGDPVPQYNKDLLNRIGDNRKAWVIKDAMSNKFRLVDAFGQPFRFRTEMGKNTQDNGGFEDGYDLWSAGIDMATDKDNDAANENLDDITNWKN